jgi:glycosyltransferase involved in cell wall biosynthesis
VFAGRTRQAPPAAPSNVRWLGYVSDDERLRLYREASMLVIASTDEGFGIPALEAMTIGLPVVAAARGSLPEVLGDAGLLVDAADPLALAAAMRRVLEDVLLRNALVDRGVARARRFNWDTSAGRLLQAFREGLARRRQRA